MSEYQYYEFQAVDRPLTKEEMAEVRALSTRAEITPTRFMNVYNWGDFRGRPERLIEKYYDAFLYEANWGTRQFALRLPRQLVSFADLDCYAGEDEYNGLTVREADDYVILNFAVNDEGGGSGWIEVEDSEVWLPTLLPIREAIANGDLRSLYLGWLMTIQQDLAVEESDDEDEEATELAAEVEPPVPPGLRNLTPDLERFIEFFEIDEDLVAMAAERSRPIEGTSLARAEMENWIRRLGESEKNELLIRLLDDDARYLKTELRKRFRQAHPLRSIIGPGESGRTRGALLHAAVDHRKARERAEREREAAEQARKQREAAIARTRYLDGLAGREESLWLRVESQAELRNATGYEEAIRLLTDLRDLAARANQTEEFRTHLAQFKERHARKPALQARILKANLGA